MEETIRSVYRILLLFEDVPEKISDKDYVGYLTRLHTQFLGKMANNEIIELVNGLKLQGTKLKHDEVKSIVFHIISLVKEGGV